MKKSSYFMVCCIILLYEYSAEAQNLKDSTALLKNLIKVNLVTLPLQMYTVQYERIVAKKQSITLTLDISPNTPLPFKNALSDKFGDNPDAQRAIESTLFTRYILDLEYRFYTGKAAPKGFYIAPFLRYMNMDLTQDYTFTPSDNKLHTAKVSSKFDAFGAGVLTGCQFLIKKHWAIDWWIIGGFYGTNVNADFVGTDPQMGSLTQEDRDKLEQDIESVNLPGYSIDATVPPFGSSSTTITAHVDGPYFGFRGFGVCLAYRF